MMTNGLGALSVFLTVAEERSFTKAAKRLGVSPSAVSHSMRELEEGIGVRLLSRTTRSVALTDAGEHLRMRLHPAFLEIGEAIDPTERIRRARTAALGVFALPARWIFFLFLSCRPYGHNS